MIIRTHLNPDMRPSWYCTSKTCWIKTCYSIIQIYFCLLPWIREVLLTYKNWTKIKGCCTRFWSLETCISKWSCSKNKLLPSQPCWTLLKFFMRRKFPREPAERWNPSGSTMTWAIRGQKSSWTPTIKCIPTKPWHLVRLRYFFNFWFLNVFQVWI